MAGKEELVGRDWVGGLNGRGEGPAGRGREGSSDPLIEGSCVLT